MALKSPMRWHCHVDHGIRIDATGRSLLGLLSAQIRPQHMSSSIGWTPFRPSCCNLVGDLTSWSPLLWTTDPRYLNSSACFDYLAVQVDLAYLLLLSLLESHRLSFSSLDNPQLSTFQALSDTFPDGFPSLCRTLLFE